MFWVGLIVTVVSGLVGIGLTRDRFKGKFPKVGEYHLDWFALILLGAGIVVMTIDHFAASKENRELRAELAEVETHAKEALEAGAAQERIIRTFQGTLKCTFVADWKNHPGDKIPIAWPKGYPAIHIVNAEEDYSAAIVLYLDAVTIERIDDNTARFDWSVSANSTSGILGRDVAFLKPYEKVLVHIPFLHRGDTSNNVVVLREFALEFVANGNRKAPYSEMAEFRIPINDEGKRPSFIFNRKDLFEPMITGEPRTTKGRTSAWNPTLTRAEFQFLRAPNLGSVKTSQGRALRRGPLFMRFLTKKHLLFHVCSETRRPA
jgi:hypothetical protein